MTGKKRLNFREYWDLIGTSNMKVIIEECGSSLKYFRLLRYGIKTPGRLMAMKIIEAARKHTAPIEPDLELMLIGIERAGKNVVNEIKPSKEYLRARKKLLAATGEQSAAGG